MIAAAVVAVPAMAATKVVAVKGFAFKPAALTVKPGTTVTWKIAGDPAPHNVTVKSGPVRFHSATGSHVTFSKKLTKKGVYHLVCTVHPNMHETVKSTDAGRRCDRARPGSGPAPAARTAAVVPCRCAVDRWARR